MARRRCSCDHSLGGGPSFDCLVHGPCQGCYMITGNMQPHDGTCDGLVFDSADPDGGNLDAMRVAYLAGCGLLHAHDGSEGGCVSEADLARRSAGQTP